MIGGVAYVDRLTGRTREAKAKVVVLCASAIESNTRPFKNSRRSVLCHRSTLPVVVGDRGAVRRCLMPFSRQIRSNKTSIGLAENRPVSTRPLSVKTSSGTPWRCSIQSKWNDWC